ncbi:MAG TPA: protein-disulfide reductase DsbD domain-containing protein [Gammaproteobacteria bacterium]|nr:protein-disulfide reductase DsbD domain-containing protein [Gammaproteobacteria bacterium]
MDRGKHHHRLRSPSAGTRRAARALAACLLATAATAALAGPGLAAAFGNGGRFLPVNQAFRFELVRTGSDTYQARWNIAPGYYLYRHRIHLVLAGTDLVRSGHAKLPPGRAEDDPEFGRVRIFEGNLTVPLTLKRTAPGAVLTVRYQGCARGGICYPPQTRHVPLGNAGTAVRGFPAHGHGGPHA